MGNDDDRRSWRPVRLVQAVVVSGALLLGAEPFAAMVPKGAAAAVSADPGPYDEALALRRLQVVYCGVSPTYEQLHELNASDDRTAFLDAALTTCLSSDYWLTEGLARLADDRVRPQASLGPSGYFNIGDYYYDYRLFEHALSGDRDARDLLTATYHIAADGSIVTGIIPDPEQDDHKLGAEGQILDPAHRAGLLTTRWNISMMTMFAVLPRNTAAQAYRSYLGFDIAQSEGLEPVAGEPRDVDHAGVKAHDCAACHSTLDPLAYAFSPYLAFTSKLPDGSARPRDADLGAYVPAARTWESWGSLFGKPVANLLDWAQQAANSEAFRNNLANMFYQQALGHPAMTSAEQADLAMLSQALPADGYSANKLLHRLIATRSFGASGPAAAPHVVWKRHKAVANDLARALALAPADVCKEVGRYSCTDEVYLAALGGNDPFAKGQYVPAASTQATTPIALERVVLSACAQRATLDAKGSPVVFTAFDLHAASLAGQGAALDAQTTILFQRMLSRDPTAREMGALHALTVDAAGKPVSALDVAKLACFIVGTTQDFAFD